MLKRLEDHLSNMNPAIEFKFDDFEYSFIRSLNLLTFKKFYMFVMLMKIHLVVINIQIL